MPQINPYLHFNGNAEEAFLFYQKVFGGEFAAIKRFKDFASPEQPFPVEEENKIMHIGLPIGGNYLMGSDTPASMGKHSEKETRSKLAITTSSKDEADRLFNGLSEGGEVEMPMEESPWGTYFGMFRDKFGIEWMIDFDTNHQ